MKHLEWRLGCSAKIPPSGRRLTRPPTCWGYCLPTTCSCVPPQDLPSADGSCLAHAYASSLETGSQCQATTDKGLAPWTQDVSKGPSSSGASRGMGRALCHRSAPPSSKPASPAGLPLRALPAHLCVPRAESSSLFPGESELQYTFYMPGTKLAPWCARTQLILTEFER